MNHSRGHSVLAVWVAMHAKLMKTRFGLLYSLVAAVVVLAQPSISAQVSAGEEAFIVLPGEASRYSGQQGREGDFTELLATADKTGGARLLSSNHRTQERPPYAPARNGS
jgi:hypothetical protein